MSKRINPNDKGYIRRKTNQLAGARMALPGHNGLREENLRAELVADFKPTNIPEKIWVGDIAHCLAAIEVRRAQIAGFYQVKLRSRAKDYLAPHPMHTPDDATSPPAFPKDDFSSDQERADIRFYANGCFQARWPHTLLADESLAILLGSLSASDVAQLRQLELALHELMRERDRIIRQIDRRRQQALRDAIMMAEERRRARAAGEKDAEANFGASEPSESAVGQLELDDNGDKPASDHAEEFSSDEVADGEADDDGTDANLDSTERSL